jgi:hypothetical protein
MPADRVGWVTPQASAARPKCFSLASAKANSSLSINALSYTVGKLGLKGLLKDWPVMKLYR